MGASAETLMKKIKQDNLISLDFICTKGLVDIYQHPSTKSYYAKVNEILLHNGYAEGNLKSSRLQMAKLKYPTVCVSKETHPVLHTRPTIYIELTPSGLSALASVYPSINLNRTLHTLSIVPAPSESSNDNANNDINDNANNDINLKSIIKSFEEAVSELTIKNENLKNELKEERKRFKNTLIDVSIHVKNLKNEIENFTDTCNNLANTSENLMNTSEVLCENLLTLIKEEPNGDNDEV